MIFLDALRAEKCSILALREQADIFLRESVVFAGPWRELKVADHMRFLFLIRVC
jgi:hypothetical protein